MANEEFEVYIEDMEGNVVVDETIVSPANGFIDLWLPRDKEFLVTITHGGKKAEAKLSTFKGDPTCITTMRLS